MKRPRRRLEAMARPMHRYTSCVAGVAAKHAAKKGAAAAGSRRNETEIMSSANSCSRSADSGTSEHG